MTKHGEPQAFIDATIAADTDECIIWPYAKGSGYGVVYKDGRMRQVCHLVLGPRQNPGMLACHSCRNRDCINPRHLRWGTYSDNQNDRMRDGTDGLGEKNPRAKLTAEDIVSIHSDSRKLREIAAQYGVGESHVCAIKKGHKWSHLTQEENING